MARVESDVLDGLRQLDSATVFNAVCEVTGANLDYTDHTVRCLLPELGTAVGFAVTAEVTTNDADVAAREWVDYYEYLEAAEGPLMVVIRDVDSNPGRGASLGDGMATLMRRFAVAGALVEGTVRDLGGIGDVGLPVWAWGTVPGHGPFHLSRLDIPVTVGQLRVCPGDLLFADLDGCARVPTERAGDVLTAGLAIAAREKEARARFAAPDFRAASMRKT